MMLNAQEKLQGMVESYFKTDGYNILDVRKGFFVADKLMPYGGDHVTYLLWVTPPPNTIENFTQIETKLLDEFSSLISQYPNAKRFIVSFTTGGFSRPFLDEIHKLDIKFRVPIQFFDTRFTYEEKPETASFMRLYADKNHLPKRINQPFSIKRESEFIHGGDDLLKVLINDFKQTDTIKQPPSKLRIIIGEAGIGKSWLFKSLFTEIYEMFLENKNKHVISARPIPFIPEYSRNMMSLRTDKLIENFLQTEVSSDISKDLFEWLLTHGFHMWFFDGLDELYTEDPSFFDLMAELLTRPESNAQILLFARNSLLNTSNVFNKFIEDYSDITLNNLIIYQLDRWEYASKRSLTWNRLEGKQPTKDSKDTPEIAKFLTMINRTNILQSLSTLPYYCDLLITNFQQGQLTDVVNEFNLVENAVNGIIQRELEKGIFSLELFDENGFEEWLGSIALEYYISDSKLLDKSVIEGYAEYVLREGLAAPVRKNILTTLVQFPLFIPGIRPSTLQFSHDIVAEYLAGKYLLNKFKTKDLSDVATKLGKRFDLRDSIIIRYIASKISDENIDLIVKTLQQNIFSDWPYSNLLQLLLLATPNTEIIRKHNILLHDRDLEYLLFDKRNLAGVSFRKSNLSHVTFKDCDLKNTLFEGAILAGTKFENIAEGNLSGAQFGDLSRFEYLYYNKRRIDEPKNILQWLEKYTGVKPPGNVPCPTSQQIKLLFHKFIQFDGTSRRDEIPEEAIYKGKRISDAPKMDDCLRTCIRFGYIIGPDDRGRYKRAPGNKYSEMIDYIKDGSLSDRLRQLLNALCPKRDCPHIP